MPMIGIARSEKIDRRMAAYKGTLVSPMRYPEMNKAMNQTPEAHDDACKHVIPLTLGILNSAKFLRRGDGQPIGL